MTLPVGLVDAAVMRLGLAETPSADLAGLTRLYGAWCQRVPFDNVLKLLHLAEGWPGRLPGSDPADFFRLWLEYGTGGTCWAGNGALFELTTALGFRAERGVCTMLVTPDTPGPNHGTVVVTLAEGRFLVDASILSGAPIALPHRSGGAEPERIASGDDPVGLDAAPGDGPLPRLAVHGGMAAVLWRSPSAPDGFPCRIERIGVDAAEWDDRHQRTAAWSPFNHAVRARLNRGADIVGWSDGKRYVFRGGTDLATEAGGRDLRHQALVDLGIDGDLAARLPDDAPTPPRSTLQELE